jgi:hypothetical protein
MHMTKKKPDQMPEGPDPRRPITKMISNAMMVVVLFDASCRAVTNADRALDALRPYLPWL